MPTIPLGLFQYQDLTVGIGLDVENDFYSVHVRIFNERFGTAIVVIGIDGIERTYNLLIPSSRLRPHSERIFNLRPVPLRDRRPGLGPLYRALPVPTLALNLSDEEPEGEDELEYQEGFGITPPTADDANREPTRLLEPAVQLLRDEERLAGQDPHGPLPPSVALAAAHTAGAHARGSTNEDSVAQAVGTIATRSVRRRTE
jgi:hypothetical protein